MPQLPRGIRFVKGNGNKKYTAILPNGKKVHFGHTAYEHYKDSVPRNLGGGIWSHKDHMNKDRRRNYRKRHGGMSCKDGRRCIDVRYSPAWFSYHYLW